MTVDFQLQEHQDPVCFHRVSLYNLNISASSQSVPISFAPSVPGSSAASANRLLISTARTSPKPGATATVLLPPGGKPTTIRSSGHQVLHFLHIDTVTTAVKVKPPQWSSSNTGLLLEKMLFSDVLQTGESRRHVQNTTDQQMPVLALRAACPASLACWQSQFKQCTSQLGFLGLQVHLGRTDQLMQKPNVIAGK